MNLTPEEELKYGFRRILNNFAPLDKWVTEKERKEKIRPVQDGTCGEENV